MQGVYVVSGFGIKPCPVEDLEDLLAQPDALVWVDIPRCDGRTAMVLSETFGFHDIAIRDCLERNHISKLHVYDDHVFTVLHAPEIGSHGHVHYVELDQFLGPNYLVTVHGPLNPAVDPAVAYLDTEKVRKRIKNGRLHPKTPFELSSAIVSALTRREINLIADLAKQSGDLERRLMLGQVGADPEPFLEELFRAWYELLAIRTIAVHSAPPTTGWPNWSDPFPRRSNRWSPTSPTGSTRSPAWPTDNANSCTGSSSSFKPGPAPT